MKGLSLLEVVIALAIVSGVLVTVLSAVNSHISLAARDRDETVAILLARQMLQDPDRSPGERMSGACGVDWPEFSWRRSLAPTPFPGVRMETMTVSRGAEKGVSLVRFVGP